MSNYRLVAVLLVSVVVASAPAMAAGLGGVTAADPLETVDAQPTDQRTATDKQVRAAAAAQVTDDEFEPNDNVDNATVLEDGTYENLSIGENDLDVYAVSLDAAETLTASIEFSNEEGDLDMALFVGDPPQIIDVSTSVNDSESVSHVAGEAGTYYLVVYGFENATGPYSLSLTTAAGETGENASAGDEFEPNDDFGNATALEPGNYTNLSIGAGDIDVFTVNATAGDVLTASIAFSHAEGDLDMALFGPNETALGSSESVTDNESITTGIPETGTYTVVVYGFDNATGAYDLSVTTAAGENAIDQDGENAIDQDGENATDAVSLRGSAGTVAGAFGSA